MRWLALVLCLLATGCYQRRMGSWIGHSSGELISVWGAPTTRHRHPGGGAIFTWVRQQSGPDGYSSCRQSFTTNPTGTIVHWAVDNCDWRTTPVPRPLSR